MNTYNQSIAESFSAAAATYDSAAHVQRAAAERLALFLPDTVEGPILDAGCGTGLLTQILHERYPHSPILGIDIAASMIEQCRQRWRTLRFEVADAESFCPDHPFDLIASNYCYQWFGDVAGGFNHMARMLHIGGALTFAVPIEGSLCELATVFREVGHVPTHGLKFRPQEAYLESMQDVGFHIIKTEVAQMRVTYPNPMSMLRSFKNLGATFTRHDGYTPMSSRTIRTLTALYADHFADTDGSVPVTYKTLFVSAEKHNG